MAVKYVKDFTFAPSPPRPTVAGYARGGHVKASTPQAYARGGHAAPCYAKGGSADIKSGVGAGTKREHFGKLSDTRSPAATRAEKSSGVQKPAFAKGGHWIAGAIKHPGALHKELGVPKGEKIPAKNLASAAKHGGVEGKRARLAETLKGFNKKAGGSAKCYAKGGRVADAPVFMGEKKAWNKDDAVSPGSPKRTPMGQGEKNKSAASNKFATEGRGTEPATKQSGDVQRMSGYSDFKNGGRIKNLGHYAHGGKVKPTRTETASGKAGSSTVKAPVKATDAGKAEKAAGTPKTSPGSRVEIKSGTARAAMGGLSRGTSGRKNAAIHAKMSKPKGAALGAIASALSGAGAPHQGPAAPPGMSPSMGAPPGGMMGGMAPQAPTMGGGPPAMADGGAMHVFHHHISHG